MASGRGNALDEEDAAVLDGAVLRDAEGHVSNGAHVDGKEGSNAALRLHTLLCRGTVPEDDVALEPNVLQATDGEEDTPCCDGHHRVGNADLDRLHDEVKVVLISRGDGLCAEDGGNVRVEGDGHRPAGQAVDKAAERQEA